MKKLFIVIAAFATFASCSKMEVQYEDTKEITLVPVTRNHTKTMMSGTTFQTSEEFNVWAYYKPVNATTMDAWMSDASTPQTYINEKTFAYNKTLQKWGGKENPYFWPKTGSLVFVGYYPTGIAAKVSHTLTGNIMSFTDIPQSRVAATGYSEDLMYFNMTSSLTQNYVSPTFKHALSWISVLLVKDADTPDAATVTVDKVEFTNVLPSGDATVTGSSAINWIPDGTAATVDILEGTPVTLSKTNKAVEPYQPLFIPQTMAGNLVITYTISSNDGSKFQEVKIVALSGMKDSENNNLTAWEAGKHYNYTITIGTTEILIDPKVENWVDVNINQTIK